MRGQLRHDLPAQPGIHGGGIASVAFVSQLTSQLLAVLQAGIQIHDRCSPVQWLFLIRASCCNTASTSTGAAAGVGVAVVLAGAGVGFGAALALAPKIASLMREKIPMAMIPLRRHTTKLTGRVMFRAALVADSSGFRRITQYVQHLRGFHQAGH